jgi:hypothetical protein
MNAPRPSLHPLFLAYIGPKVEVIKQCIHFLRPELTESEVSFLGISLLGLVAGHHLMRGLNHVVWGKSEFIGNSFQASERLVDFCLHGLLAESDPMASSRVREIAAGAGAEPRQG